jgi:hypothetical protein
MTMARETKAQSEDNLSFDGFAKWIAERPRDQWPEACKAIEDNVGWDAKKLLSAVEKEAQS